MSSSSNNTGCTLLCTGLALLFIGLKLTNNIDWDWVWVLAPIWIPTGFGLFVLILFLIFLLFTKRV